MEKTLQRPARGDSLMNISLIAGVDDDDFNAIYVSSTGDLRAQNLVWNTATLAWEANTTGIGEELTSIRRILEELLIITRGRT